MSPVLFLSANIPDKLERDVQQYANEIFGHIEENVKMSKIRKIDTNDHIIGLLGLLDVSSHLYERASQLVDQSVYEDTDKITIRSQKCYIVSGSLSSISLNKVQSHVSLVVMRLRPCRGQCPLTSREERLQRDIGAC